MVQWRDKTTRDNLFDAIENKKEIIVYDLETTGLSPKNNRIIQFSGIKFVIEGNKTVEIERLDTYVKPIQPIPAKITEITGISAETVKNAPTEAELFPKLKAFFGNAFVASGYNVLRFDNKFMEQLYARFNDSFTPLYTLDILTMAKDNIEKKETENFTLSFIAERYGVDKELTFHNAIDDVIATKELLVIFKDLYTETKNEDDGIIVDTETDVVSTIERKKVSAVYSISFWAGFKGHSRVYITTDLGDFYYDVWEKIWKASPKNNPYATDEVDMDSFRAMVFKKYGITDERELVGVANPPKTKKKVETIKSINSIRYWEKTMESGRVLKRIYVQTDLGNFYYDINKKTWAHNPDNHSIVEYEQLEAMCLTATKTNTIEEFAQKRVF